MLGLFLVWVSLVSFGCATGPRTTGIEFFQLTPESAANRAMQTREFETANSDELLSASAAVLQDLGFQIAESQRSLGFLRAAKERSAREYGQEVGQGIVGFLTFALSALGGSNVTLVMPVDLQQQINASLVAYPLAPRASSLGDEEDEGQRVRNELRIVFYRLIWKGEGQQGDTYIPPGEQKMEMIRDAELYQRFFARLNKAVFLEAEKI
ncbi:MAG: hypothetical protein AB8G23_21450 [Myxococcota bacterium]